MICLSGLDQQKEDKLSKKRCMFWGICIQNTEGF